MKIQLGDNYVVETDSRQYIINYYTGSVDAKGYDTKRVVGMYGMVEELVVAIEKKELGKLEEFKHIRDALSTGSRLLAETYRKYEDAGVYLNNGMRISKDTRQYMLQKGAGLTKDGKEEFMTLGHYSNFNRVFEGLLEMELKRINLTTTEEVVGELMGYIDSLRRYGEWLGS